MIKADDAMGYRNPERFNTDDACSLFLKFFEDGCYVMFLIDYISKSVIWRAFDGNSGYLTLFLGISLANWTS